jgi:NhaP-type Na+/H+ or K+/H+ antiporter
MDSELRIIAIGEWAGYLLLVLLALMLINTIGVWLSWWRNEGRKQNDRFPKLRDPK